MSKSDQAPTDAKEATSDQEIYLVNELLKIKGDGQGWIVKELLPRDGQIILSGPPKTGKSYIATDLAISLSRPFKDAAERRFLFAPPLLGAITYSPPASSATNKKSDDVKTSAPSEEFEIERPEKEKKRGWRVLFFSLEMGRGLVTLRYRQQLAGHGLLSSERNTQPDQEIQLPADQTPDLHTSFGVKIKEDLVEGKKGDKKPGSTAESRNKIHQDLKILEVKERFGESPVFEETQCFKKLNKIISDLKPEVVIYDSLIQLHEFDENDNIKMKRLLRALRDLNTITYSKDHKVKVAHLIIHHNRKEYSGRWSELSADSMRGAGAIHAVADLAMMVRPLAAGKPGAIAKAVPGVGPDDGLVEVHISSRNSAIDNFALCRKDKVFVHTVVSLSEIKKAQKAQKAAQKRGKKPQKPEGKPMSKLKQEAFDSVYPAIMNEQLQKLNAAKTTKDRDSIAEEAYSVIKGAMKKVPGVTAVGTAFVKERAKELTAAVKATTVPHAKENLKPKPKKGGGKPVKKKR